MVIYLTSIHGVDKPITILSPSIRTILDHTFSLRFLFLLQGWGQWAARDFVGLHLRSDDFDGIPLLFNYHSCGYINYIHYIWIILMYTISTIHFYYTPTMHQLYFNYQLYIYTYTYIQYIIYICLMVRLPGHQWFGDPRSPLRRRFRRRTGNRRDTWWKHRHRFGVSMAATSWFYNPKYINSSIGI